MPDDPIESSDASQEEDEIEARLRDIEEKARQARAGARFPDPPEWNYTRKRAPTPTGSEYKGLGFGLAAAYALLGMVFFGWGIGWLIDRSSGGITGQAIGVTLGGIAGLGAALFMLNRGSQ